MNTNVIREKLMWPIATFHYFDYEWCKVEIFDSIVLQDVIACQAEMSNAYHELYYIEYN